MQKHLHSLHAATCRTFQPCYGAKVQDTSQIAQTLKQELGVPRVHHLLFVEAHDKRQSQFLALCRECNVTLPWSAPITQQVEAAGQSRQTCGTSYDAKPLDVPKYQLEESYFRLPTHKPASLPYRLTNHQSGVYMTTSAKLQPWTCAQQRVTADALAVFMVGQIDQPEELRLLNHFAAQKILAPALDDQGRKVVLAGLLVQLGELRSHHPKMKFR